MSDCRKIDKLLWLYPDLSASQKDELERHLSVCSKCRQAFETIQTLADSAHNDQRLLSDIDPAAFDAEVMRKIRRQKALSQTPRKISEKSSDRYVLRMAFSYALAAIVVLFLTKSISDLGSLTPPTTISQQGQNENYNILNLQLRAPVTLPSPPAESASKLASKDQKKSQEKSKITAAPQVLAEAPPVASAPVIADTTPVLTMHNAPESLAADTLPTLSMRNQEPPPLAGMASLPESVNVGDIALARSGRMTSDMQTQYRAASRPEFYALPGSVQVAPTQSSVLVTMEKIPKAVKMVTPEYPVWAQKQALSGTVWIRARVESDGNIKEAEIISCDSPGLGFEDAALKAARESVFIPASANGINLAVWIEYPVRFICKK